MPRRVESGEVKQFLHVVRRVFRGDTPSGDLLKIWAPTLDPDRTLGVFEGPELVATASVEPLMLTVPGGLQVAAAGVTNVAVRSTHRRRGLLTALMRSQLRDIRERGEPIALLWAAESTIYGRFGYGAATLDASIEVARSASAFRSGFKSALRVREVDEFAALETFPCVAAEAAGRRPGFVRRVGPTATDWWRMRLAGGQSSDVSATGRFLILCEGDAGPEGYAIYTLDKKGWSDGVLRVQELVTVSDEAYGALWRHCFDVDLISVISAEHRHVEEPLYQLLANRRAATTRVSDGLWVRIVDVVSAMQSRSYGTSGRIVIDLMDPCIEEDSGIYTIEADSSGAVCRKANRSADLVMSCEALSSVYLGGVSFSQLFAAGLVEERTCGALAVADALFASNEGPWCPFDF